MPLARLPTRTAVARSGPARALLAAALVVVGLAQSPFARAQVMADWGTVSTPVTSDVTFSFAQYDVMRNFTHQYLFSLEGSAGATYTVTFNFDTCRTGCGNPGLSYGIYDSNGGALDPVSGGTYVLTAGAYSFQVKADGMGAGNAVDYWGAVVISGLGADIVAPVPEPETLLLLVPGALVVAWVSRRRARRLAALVVPAALALQGCQDPLAAGPTQVLARVNGVEISVHQLEHAVRVERATQAGEPDRAALLEKLIDRQLAVQQAVERKLDRQAEVLERLEELRRDVLASAYADALSAARKRPAIADIEAFYAAHPELFARRKIYHLRELAQPAASPLAADAKRRLAAGEPLENVLRDHARAGARTGAQSALRAAEQLPLQALARMQSAREGETVVFESPRTLYAYQVLAVQAAPLDLAAATPLIAEHLARRDGRDAMAQALRGLRSVAVIEYLDGAAGPRPGSALARN